MSAVFLSIGHPAARVAPGCSRRIFGVAGSHRSVPYIGGYERLAYETVDVDHDGRPDIVCTRGEGDLWVYRNVCVE